MMQRIFFVGFLIMTLPCGAAGDGLLDRYWIVQELFSPPDMPCDPQLPCGEGKSFEVLPFLGPRPERLRRIYDQMAALTADGITPHPDQPMICAAHAAHSAGAAGVYIPEGWEPERLDMSAKNEGLHDLTAVHIDLSGLAAPKGWQGEFGPEVQRRVEVRFAEEGLRILTKEEVDLHPGQPKMAVFLSHTNPDTGCWWSVFSSVTETAVLTRDLNVKLRAGIWSQSAGFSADNPEQAEIDAIMMIVETFLADWQTANGDGFDRTNVPPYEWDADGNLVIPDG